MFLLYKYCSGLKSPRYPKKCWVHSKTLLRPHRSGKLFLAKSLLHTSAITAFFFFNVTLNVYLSCPPLFSEKAMTPYSCLENPMDRGAWWAAVHGVAKSRTWLSDFTFTFTLMYWRRKWKPTPVFLPGESQGRGSLVGCHLWGRTQSDMAEVT